MPILARLSRFRDSLVAQPVDDRALNFRSLDGSDLLSWTGREYVIMSGIQGLRVAPREVIAEKVPGLDGARLREIRTDVRNVVIPFAVFGSDFRAHLAQMASIRTFLDFRGIDYATAEGTFDLVATRGDDAARSLRCTYLDGMAGVEGLDNGNGPDFSTFDMSLLAVDPFWRGQEWTTPVVSVPAARPFLSDDAGDHPWGLGSSVALGADMPVNVTGDVPSPAIIEIVGPATATHITSPQGLDVTIGSVGAGETLVVDTGRRKRILLDGASAWDLLGDSPQWRPFLPGGATISVVVTGATADTRARVYGTSLWETAW